MANTLKNIIEGIENDNQYESTLRQREQKIRTFSPLGPPDLCYLTKQFQRSFSLGKPTVSGFFHFTYGVNSSSPAAISAYISNILRMQEAESSWFSNGKWVIKKAEYCIYDCFSKVDIHLEIRLPGNMTLFGKNSEGQMVNIDDRLWERAYISSVLRSFMRKRAPLVKIYKELEQKEELEHFLNDILKLIYKRELYLEGDREGINTCGSEVLSIVFEYLTIKKRFFIAEGFYRKLSEYDQKYVFFLSEIFEKKGEFKEAVRQIATVLVKNPHIISLLFKQSKYLLKLERNQMALKLAKVVVQLAPESFEAWYHLIEVLYQSRQYEMVMLTMNIAPTTAPSQYDDALDINCEVTNPKVQTDCNYFFFSQEADRPDHRYTNGNEEHLRAQSEYQELNEKLRGQLDSLPALTLEEQENRLYKILVKLERELGWEKLLSIRSQLFLTDIEVIQQNEAYESIIGKGLINKLPPEDYEIYENGKPLSAENLNNLSMNDASFNGIKQGAESLIEQRKKYQATMKKEVELSDDSEEELELPSFLKLDQFDNQNEEVSLQKNIAEIKHSKNIQNWEQKRSKKITEMTNETFETEPNMQLKGNLKKPSVLANNQEFNLKEAEESKEQDSDEEKNNEKPVANAEPIMAEKIGKN
jgi:Chs5-Arf1p-binding protein BUD7/BCH1